jgi:predicted RNase H-like HicB family nuclease
MRTFVYPARFERGHKPGVLVITFRDFSEAITQGKGEKDALWQAADCLEEAIAGRIAGGRAIPKASKAARGERPIPVPAPMAAKAALYLAMGEAGMTKRASIDCRSSLAARSGIVSRANGRNNGDSVSSRIDRLPRVFQADPANCHNPVA